MPRRGIHRCSICFNEWANPPLVDQDGRHVAPDKGRCDGPIDFTPAKRGCQCGGKALGHNRFVHFWQRMTAWSITLEGEMTWWATDDNHHRTRKLDHELRIPLWVFRPVCWWEGKHDDFYGCCVTCGIPILTSPYRRRKEAP